MLAGCVELSGTAAGLAKRFNPSAILVLFGDAPQMMPASLMKVSPAAFQAMSVTCRNIPVDGRQWRQDV